MEPLRVTHFAHADHGSGASANALRLHRGLAHEGIESRLWVVQRASGVPGVMQLRDRGFLRRRVRELEPWLEARVLGGLFPGPEPPLSSGLLGHDPVPIVARDAADVVQLHWLGCATLSLRRLPQLKRPIVWRLADMWALCGAEHLCEEPERFLSAAPDGSASSPLVDRAIVRAKQWVYEHVEDLTLVTPSRWLAELVGQSRLLAGRPVEVIPTGCDTELFRPLDRAACRELLQLPDRVPLVLAGSTNLTVRHKGLDLFVEAARVVRNTLPDARFVVFGPHSGEVARALPQPVIDCGSIADPLRLALLYSACDVLVAPSRIENLSNTVLEALACGTPCAAFAIGGMPDAIAHRETGFLAQPFEVEELAAGVVELLRADDPSAMRARCRTAIEARFGMAAQAKAFAALYRRLAARGSTSR